ncbi:MAG TPA: class I SAM-dependent methyltransferase [Candidatus Udaeobacter sp.]
MKSQLAPRLFSPEPVRVVSGNDQAHWERVYADGCEDVSWFQARPDLSLRLIASSGVDKHAGIIDVGGGASSLVDCLLDEDYSPVAVLDISPTALRYARDRLGSRARLVNWFEADVTTFDPPRRFGLWHDRAVFHFLTDAAQRRAYVQTLRRTLTSDGTVIIATFATDGPTRCSGLPVERYDARKISAELGPEFSLIEQVREAHRTPSGSEQAFSYFEFRWEPRATHRAFAEQTTTKTKQTNHEIFN